MELLDFVGEGLSFSAALPATYNAIVTGAGTEITTPGKWRRTRDAEDGAVLDGDAAEVAGIGVVIDAGQRFAGWDAGRGCNRNSRAAGREDNSVERRVV